MDNFNDVYINCKDLDSNDCLHNVNCRLYNVGGNRNTSEKCAQSAAATGTSGYKQVIQSDDLNFRHESHQSFCR